jgi:hypothetical protein
LLYGIVFAKGLPLIKTFLFMKKIMFVAMLLTAATISISAQTTFGIKGGANQNTFYLKTEDTGGDTRYTLTNPGFHFGGVVNLQVSDKFSVQPQLLLVNKGGKLKMGGDETEFNFYTIDVPINLLYTYNGFFIGGGPNLSVGLSAKGKSTGSPDIDLYDDDALGAGSNFKRFEIGANVTTGFRFPSGFMISTNWTPGLSDIYAEPSGGTGSAKANNSFFGFSVGYMFGGSKVAAKK